MGNLVISRINPDLGIGKIIKVLDIPSSHTLDEKDSFIITKYKVKFQGNIIKIYHPIDLVHFIFQVNEKISTYHDENFIGIINSNDFEIKDGLLSYEVLTSSGKKTQVFENEILIFEEDQSLLDLSKNRIASPKEFLLKFWAYKFLSYYSSYQIKCITNSRLTLMPHQINVAHRLSEDFFPRILLADEVGLGKTIEAGIYLKEMQARNLADRILIIVPATLVNQWAFEMENKFNLDFKIYDGKRIRKLKRKGDHRINKVLENPFYYDNLIICSLQFARNPKYANLLSKISWDIVIFDEAHHLRRYLLNSATGNYRETLNYELAKKLSYISESVLLLTATPLQLHSFELYSLIELIQPSAFDNFSDFEHFRKNMPFINLMINNINNIKNLNTFELENTLKLIKKLNYIGKKLSKSQVLKSLKSETYKNSLISKIESDHTLSKFLIRNRKKNVFSDEFLNERIVRTILIKPTETELEIYNEIRLYLAKIYNNSLSEKSNIGLGFVITTLQKLLTSSKYAIMKSIERRLDQIDKLKAMSNFTSEMKLIQDEDPDYYQMELEDETIENGETFNESKKFKKGSLKEESEEIISLLNHKKILNEFYKKLKKIPYDSKSSKLIDLISELYEKNSQEKILIFTQFVDTLMFLKKELNARFDNIFIDTFYGGKNKKEKAETVENFKKSKKFSILLSTEIGGEGRNFQFCRILINYDLPWNPMKLEQRIGRLDRIGQKSKQIFIYNLFLEGTIETDVIFALNKRINLFEESIGNLEPILGKIEKNFKDLIFIQGNQKQKKLREFNRELESEIKKAKEIEIHLDDLLIDKKSFQYEGLISNLTCDDVKLTNDELFFFMKVFFNLDNQKYGKLINIKSNQIDQKLDDLSFKEEFLIEPSIRLQEIVKDDIRKKYHGTFNLEVAKEKEEIDFFALGHPLMNHILKFIKSSKFQGDLTMLKVKRQKLRNILNSSSLIKANLVYLFIFSIEFQGFINEKQIQPVFMNQEGYIYHGLNENVLDFQTFQELFEFNSNGMKSTLPFHKIEELKDKAIEFLNVKFSKWKKNVKKLSSHIYQKEIKKKEKIHNYKTKVLHQKISSKKEMIEKKKLKLPTERQKENIRKMEDLKRKEERLEKVRTLREDIDFLKADINKLRKRVDDLAFRHEDEINSLKKSNKIDFFNQLIGFAKIEIIE